MSKSVPPMETSGLRLLHREVFPRPGVEFHTVIDIWGKDEDSPATSPEMVEAGALSLQNHYRDMGITLGFLNQTHSNNSLHIQSRHAQNLRGLYWGDASEADAAFSRLTNTAIAVRTADCIPILFFHPKTPFFGGIHAGWRGFENQIIRNTLLHAGRAWEAVEFPTDMEFHTPWRPQELQWVVGPFIAGENYEVGPEFSEIFPPQDLQSGPHAGPDAGPHKKKLCLNMRSPLERHLRQAIHHEDEDAAATKPINRNYLCMETYTHPQLYSHRGGDQGRNFSIIYTTPNSATRQKNLQQ